MNLFLTDLASFHTNIIDNTSITIKMLFISWKIRDYAILSISYTLKIQYVHYNNHKATQSIRTNTRRSRSRTAKTKQNGPLFGDERSWTDWRSVYRYVPFGVQALAYVYIISTYLLEGDRRVSALSGNAIVPQMHTVR